MLERTLIRNWVKLWLDHLHWYHTVASQPDVRLQDFLRVRLLKRPGSVEMTSLLRSLCENHQTLSPLLNQAILVQASY